LGGLLEESAHEKSPKCLDGNLGDFREFCKGLGLFLLRMNEFDTGRKAAGMQARAVYKAMRFHRFNIRRNCSPAVVARGYPL